MFKARYLLSAALAPAVFLFFYIRKKDKIEREPLKLLLALAGLGAVSTISAGIYESVMIGILDAILPPYSFFNDFAECFLFIAPAEEGVKLIVLFMMTWKSKEFDYSFDAVVYAVSVSLGFAGLENILYVSDGGFAVALLRAITSVPGHAIFAVFMGYFYGMAKKMSCQKKTGLALLFLMLMYIVPITLHGFYDFCLTVDNGLGFVSFFVFDIAITVVGVVMVNLLSKHDAPLVRCVTVPNGQYMTFNR